MSRDETWPAEWPHLVVARGLGDVERAVARGLATMVLLSPPHATSWGGVGWWRALADAARQQFPGRIAADVLDCGEAAGLALAAIRMGQGALILRATAAGRAHVVAIAAAAGVTMLCVPPPPALAP
jgi:hypothetical protein